jgi:hypothetical protein
VKIGSSNDPYGKGPEGKGADASQQLPTFTYRVLAGDQPIPSPDPATGLIHPGRIIAKTYRLEGNICRRLLAPGLQPEPEAHPDPEPIKKKEKLAKRHRR